MGVNGSGLDAPIGPDRPCGATAVAGDAVSAMAFPSVARRFAATPPFTLPAVTPPGRLRSPQPVSPALDLGGEWFGDHIALAQRMTGGEEPEVREPDGLIRRFERQCGLAALAGFGRVADHFAGRLERGPGRAQR